MKRIMLVVIKIYQRTLSPLFPPRCRFHPTCSVYSYQAISEYGMIKGGYLALRRILRCHPFNKGGYDPIPTRNEQ